ncbi:MAG: hypothetical protein KGY66_03270 [Candidatus Thermoplasmatota archaeon]|nr:hypothetical protein [Candidatus Thermoplasmatota archaeon]MBS3789915.1 hypothetical protein [Candidatus Thermoplasmatota archaeon]
MQKGKRDGKPLLALKVLVSSLPLLLKLAFVFLKYKRVAKKRKKIFKKTLKKEGLREKVAEELSEELPEFSIRDLVSNNL